MVANGLGQLDGMGTSWEVWGWSWLDIGLNPTSAVLCFIFCVCLFVCFVALPIPIASFCFLHDGNVADSLCRVEAANRKSMDIPLH